MTDINCQLLGKKLPITLNLDVTSILDQALLFMVNADLGYVFIVANKKFLNAFVRAFTKSDVQSTALVNSTANWKCHATVSLNLGCSH